MPAVQASLARRFGRLSAALVALPTAVCAAILWQVGGMNNDADRLLEETRESGVSSRLVVRIESLAAVLESDEKADLTPRFQHLALEQLEEARATLSRLDSTPEEHDPSRSEHEDAEEDYVATIGSALDAVARWLDGDRSVSLTEVLSQLERARRFASVLSEETYRESVLANDDVERRTRASITYAIGGIAAVLLGSTAVWAAVVRFAIKPLDDLRAGAERLRSGRFDHRIDVRGDDEVGALGRAFNAMADEIGRSHAELEQKIETRTLELIRAARLADVGVLAAGIAHEINNPLASIASSGEGLLRRLDAGTLDPREEREYLETIVSEAYRTRTITSRLLDLSRPAGTSLSAIAAEKLFGEVGALTRELLRAKDLTLEVAVERGLMAIEGDAGELLQVLVNLVLNARDASPRGAVVRLEARNVGDAQEWSVSDRGHGIAPANLERVFDPFFTTKEPGVGTGLGLSLALAIVDRHGGSISASNRAEGGACFTIRFPHRSEVRA
jgi:two-component system NtrC family sensor kinase